MKEIMINDNQLTEEDIEKEVIRVKALMINSKGKILVAHNNNTYQFPGGHIEENESFEKCLIREIKEETGITIEELDRPFLCITTYAKNYFDTGKNIKSKIYYYVVYTDEEPNYGETHYDELELSSDFNLYYVNIKDLEDLLQKGIEDGIMDQNIAREISYVMREYEEKYGEKE